MKEIYINVIDNKIKGCYDSPDLAREMMRKTLEKKGFKEYGYEHIPGTKSIIGRTTQKGTENVIFYIAEELLLEA